MENDAIFIYVIKTNQNILTAIKKDENPEQFIKNLGYSLDDVEYMVKKDFNFYENFCNILNQKLKNETCNIKL